MKSILFFLLLTSTALHGQTDWLLSPIPEPATVTQTEKELTLTNGLISRTFRTTPTLATISLKNHTTGEEYIRSVKPEGFVVIEGVSYRVGGLVGQPEHGYFQRKWLDTMTAHPDAFRFQTYEVKQLEPQISWGKTRWVPDTQWESRGKELICYFTHPRGELKGIEVKIHYEIYEGIPLISKWMEVTNKGDKNIRINHFTSEIIAHPEKNNFVDAPDVWQRPNLYIENDFAFGGFTYEESDQAIVWETDSQYTSQVNWKRSMPCVLKSQPKTGPEFSLKPGSTFETFRTYVLALDGTDRERNSLSKRKMYRTLAPWVTENPIFLHLTSTDPKEVRNAIDQCVETGYEMVILSFGSGLTMEDVSPKNIAKYKELVDYAHQKGIQLGGYSLFSSRRIDDDTDVIDLKTGLPGGAKFGHAPCGGSKWGITYFENLKEFIEKTGFDILEHDGPYPGDFCAAPFHPGHEGHGDSQWKQWRQTTDFYKWLRAKGVYTNIPDMYLLSGSNKVGIGYREVNWSLPREQQILLGRQNIYDGTWLRTPSMGWTFVPLTEYQGGGEVATLEPLAEHLPEYEAHMTQNYGSGVQACYRGPRLYDTEETKKLVKNQIAHYKKYRDILNADIIHLRRPDGRDWDGILHVDPQLSIKGLAMLYNPTETKRVQQIKLPLYYTGLTDTATVTYANNVQQKFALDREYSITVTVTIPANGSQFLRIE